MLWGYLYPTNIKSIVKLIALPVVAFLTLAGVLTAQVNVNTGGTGNGIVMTNGTDPGGTASTVSIFADMSSGRGRIYNGTTGPSFIATWPCTMSGCIVYANATNQGETALQPMGTQGAPLLAGSSGIPQWGATDLDLQTNAMATEFPIASGGTTVHQLVILSGTGVLTPSASSPQGVEGICVLACNPTGTALIAREGTVSCTFENAVTAGHYVQAGTTTPGDCRDTGSSTFPTNGNQVLGRALVSGAAGLRSMILYPPGSGLSIITTVSGNTTKAASAATALTTCTNGNLLKADGSGNVTCGAAGIPLLFSTGNGTASGGGTTYIGVGSSSATEGNAAITVSQAGTTSNLNCRVPVALGTSGSFALNLAKAQQSSSNTVVQSFTDQLLACTLSNSTTTNAACQDSTHTFSVVANDVIVIKSTGTSTTGQSLSCSVIFTL